VIFPYDANRTTEFGSSDVSYYFFTKKIQGNGPMTDRGPRQFNCSKVLGAFAAKAVSNAYPPK